MVSDFLIKSEQNAICFSPDKRDLYGNNHCGISNGFNLIEFSYSQSDEEGWGAGGGEYVTTQDILSLSNGVKGIINREKTSFSYHCLNDIITVSIEVVEDDMISMTFSMLETLEREHYITVTVKDLSFAEFEEKTKPFIEWETKFPTLSEDWLPLYNNVYDTIFKYDVQNSSEFEAHFEACIMNLLENRPFEFGDALNKISAFLDKRPDVEAEALADFIGSL